ncbi:PREDICTED: uncharacterized protein LOC106807225 [Priapulus caudatus]|uniref:Uncharacterized protein LOC106807225 n=1 Tax=Priapulus caudatus TaxID=37621 RepID=A0ABM1DYH8_PRICU|nr:PREDICTED: uncharacterized protein LOC106807225 [Priapulus caudatus]
MALDYVEDEEILVEQLKETAFNRSSSSAAGIDWKVILVYVQCYFVSIATILGTGILGLPVTLAHAGFYPFLLSFLTGFLMQVLLIYLFVELLQKAYAVLNADSEGCSEADNIESVPLHPLRGELGSDDELEDLQNGEILAGHVILPRHGASVKHPNLHSIAALFLGCCSTQAFDVIILIQFVSLLTSYALAGSEAYAAVIGIEHFYVIPVFVWCLTACVVFAHQIIQPVVSVLTLAKGGVLIVTVSAAQLPLQLKYYCSLITSEA